MDVKTYDLYSLRKAWRNCEKNRLYKAKGFLSLANYSYKYGYLGYRSKGLPRTGSELKAPRRGWKDDVSAWSDDGVYSMKSVIRRAVEIAAITIEDIEDKTRLLIRRLYELRYREEYIWQSWLRWDEYCEDVFSIPISRSQRLDLKN